MARFEATQSIELWVQDQPVAIQHYLKQPQRLVRALVDANQIENQGDGRFRLKMRPMSFMMLSIQPIVDIRVWHGSGDCLFLESLGCQILGSDYVAQRFHLHLAGFLRPKPKNDQTLLTGTAHLKVEVDLPPALLFTPKPLIDAGGNGLLKGVLQTMKQRLRWRLVADYQSWCKTTLADSAATIDVEASSGIQAKSSGY